MIHITITNTTRRTELGSRIAVADGFWSRLRGLLGREITSGEGMLLVPCRAVHTFGMRYDLDIVFIDGNHRVVRICPELAPNRTSGFCETAHAVLELPRETLAQSRTNIGDQLLFHPATSTDL